MSSNADDLKIETNEKIKNLLNLWIHQNQLLWGRLQTVSALQVGVFGGWYAVFVNRSSPANPILGSCIAGLGIYLAWRMRGWIIADRELRDEKRDQIRSLDGGFLLPDNGKGKNADKMIGMVSVFVSANTLLFVLSIAKPLCRLSRWIVCGG